jgi:uncharacterized membrane protein
MIDVVVIEFVSEAKAEEVRELLLQLQREYLIELEDAIIAIKQPDGRIRLNELSHPVAGGAVSGSLLGLIVGAFFLMPVTGAALGAATGALGGALADANVDEPFIEGVTATLESGSAALFLLLRKVTTDKVLAELKGVGGTVLRTSFDRTRENALREAIAAAGVGQPTRLTQ